MFLSDISIRRPVFAAVIMLALVTLGVFSYVRLPIDFEPNIDIPIVTVVTRFPGASPETVEREVSKRIEESVNPIPGVKKLTSTSRESVSFVVVEFRLEVPISEAANDVRAKVAAIRGAFPDQVEDPIVQKLDLGALPVISLSVQSDRLTPRELTTIVDRRIKRRLESLPGVGKVDLVGTARREVRVLPDTARLEYLGMGINELIAGLQSENLDAPVGRLTGSATEATVRIVGKPDRVGRFEEMVIAQRDGRPIALGEVARIEDGVEEQRSLALVNGTPAVALNIIKQSGANAVAVVDAVNKQLETLGKELPEGLRINVVRDGSTMVRESIHDLKSSILLGGALTILVVFCFLNSWRSTVITGLTLPISVISSFIIMNALHMSLNVMTMMGLSLVIGILIDDAIVVRENIVRHLEMGKSHFQAARDGTSEIGLAVLATTLSLLAVFIPVAFMRGIVGLYFFQFGMTVAFAVAVSLLVSFTLDPMLSSRWPDPAVGHGARRWGLGRLLQGFSEWFDRLADRYSRWLAWALDHRKTVVALSVAAFLVGMGVMGALPKGFMTDFDRGEFQVNFSTAPSASLEESRGRVEAMLAALQGLPEIEQTYATVGAGDTGTVRDGGIYIKLVDRAQRKRSQEQVRQEVRQRLANIPGIRYSVERDVSWHAAKPLQVQLRGEDLGKLKAYGQKLKAIMAGVPGVVDLETSMDVEAPEYQVRVDRQRAADAGLRSGDITGTLAILLGGSVASTYEDEAGESVDVRVRLPEAMRHDATQMGALRLMTRPNSGAPGLVAIGDLARFDRAATPGEIQRESLTRQVTVGANIDGVALSQAVEIGKKSVDEMQLDPGYVVYFGGEANDMAESFGYMFEAIFLAIVFVYLVLAAQFESFLDPFAIMFSLPLSILGMAALLLLTGDTLNIMSMIGLIMLVGLVTKNAILLVDYAKVLRRRDGLGRREALILSGRTRLRPILMTTVAMILGMMPVALAIGAGAEFRAPMARAVVGGLITSTVLTLLIVPVVYTLLDDATAWLVRLLGIHPVEHHEASDNGPANEALEI